MAAIKLFARLSQLLDVAVTRAAAVWPRFNADGTVSQLTAADTRTALAAAPTDSPTFTGNVTLSTGTLSLPYLNGLQIDLSNGYYIGVTPASLNIFPAAGASNSVTLSSGVMIVRNDGLVAITGNQTVSGTINGNTLTAGTGTLTLSTYTLTANATGTVYSTGNPQTDITGNAGTVTVADTTDSTCYVALFESATGNLAAKTDGGITYDASSGALVVSSFGASGNVAAGTLLTPTIHFTHNSGSGFDYIVTTTDALTVADRTITYTYPDANTTIAFGGNVSTSAALATTGTSGVTLAAPSTGAPIIYTLPTTAATLARTDAGQTFTGTQTFGAIGATSIGATTRGTGAFTTLAANGAVTFTAGTASTSTGTGTLVVTGGAGFSGAVYVGAVLNVPFFSGGITFGTGTVAGTGCSMTSANGGALNVYAGGGISAAFSFNSFGLTSGGHLGFTGNASDPTAARTSTLSQSSAGVLQVGTTTNNASGSLLLTKITVGGGAEAAATTATKLTKLVSSIADATATDVLTVTVPNAAHAATVRVKLLGRLGAGGAIGADEASRSICYDIDIARTAGVNAVAVIGTAFGGTAGASVAGAATITVTSDLSAISGAVGATNTFTVRVTITRGSGSSANHKCTLWAEILNANATGITIA